MSSQIFKNKIPISIIVQLLEDIAVKSVAIDTNAAYIVNNNVYKKGIFNGKILEFYELCRPYYHISKRKYLDKKMSYNSFITVIRQICNSKQITYTSQIKYDKSSYDIIYSILIPKSDLDLDSDSDS